MVSICLFLAGSTWVVFGQTLNHGFVNFDDYDYVLKNPHVAGGLTSNGIAWAFTHLYASNWHPLTWLSHMLDCQLYGLNPRGHHLTNVLLHAATSVILFLTLRQMTAALWRSAFVAAAFAIHPLRVESVAWVAERKDVLSGFFFVLTLAAYQRYTRGPWSAGRYALVLVLFALGLMCKPMLVTLPFVLLLLDYWPLHRFAAPFEVRRRLIIEKLPFLTLAVAAGATTFFAQTVATRQLTVIPFSARLFNAVTAASIYVRQMFWPAGLAAFYPYPPGGTSFAAVLLSLVLLVGISALVFLLRGRGYLVTGWLWYLIMLGPVIGIIQAGPQARADRYTYLPQIGLALALTWAAADLCARWRPGKAFLAKLSVIILVGLIVTARAQVSLWQDNELLWRHALACTVDNPTARANLAHALHEKGRRNEAVAQYESSLQLDPVQALVHSNMGATLLEMGRADEAVAHFEKALKIDPTNVEALGNLGLVLLNQNQAGKSVAYFERALAIDPHFGDAHYNLGNAFLELGRAREAVTHYAQAIELDPRDERALSNLAWILATWPEKEIRDGGKAVEFASRADALSRNESPIISATLAAAYAEAGRLAEAVRQGEHASELAAAQGNRALANSIRAQLQHYQSGSPFRDHRDSQTIP